MEAGMVGDFFGWIFGALLLLAVFIYVLDFLGLVGIVEAVGALVSLAASVIGMLAALLIWSARKLIATSRAPAAPAPPQNPAPDERASSRRGSIETKTMARPRGQK
jgi:hypothetical protein